MKHDMVCKDTFMISTISQGISSSIFSQESLNMKKVAEDIVEEFINELATMKKILILSILSICLSGCAQNPELEPGIHVAKLSGTNIWYHIIGDGKSTPILMLHGGPGGTSYSLYALSDLADEYTLILLDQPGTGRSENLQDTSLMKMDLFLEHLHNFVEYIGLKEYIVYGHS